MKKITAHHSFVLFISIMMSTSNTTTKHPFYAYIMRTRAGFHISRYYNQLRFGSNFTFHQIAGDAVPKNQRSVLHHGIFIAYDPSGNIKAINDGKQTPLFLASIPTKQCHIDQLAQQCNPQDNRSIGIFTLNEHWECETSGLSELIKNNEKLTQFHYPTPDFDAPSLSDLIRAVKDLDNRDNTNQKLSLVHCKAGRGRSATVVAAYLMYVMHTAGQDTTADAIEKYLITHRPQVHLGQKQKNILNRFYNELKKAGSLEKLCKKHNNQ